MAKKQSWRSGAETRSSQFLSGLPNLHVFMLAHASKGNKRNKRRKKKKKALIMVSNYLDSRVLGHIDMTTALLSMGMG